MEKKHKKEKKKKQKKTYKKPPHNVKRSLLTLFRTETLTLTVNCCRVQAFDAFGGIQFSGCTRERERACVIIIY